MILCIRPEPGCAATALAARAAGLAIEPCPLSEIRSLAWDRPAPGSFDALLLGSANALRHGGAGLEAFRGKPAFVVGAATAEAARGAGLTVAATGGGGLQALLDTETLPPRLLRLAGAEHLALAPPSGTTIETRIVYTAETLPLPVPLATRLAEEPSLVLLHSAAAARHFAAECDRLQVPRNAIALAALGPRIAVASGTGWRAVHSAAAPCDPALLALAADVCHDPGDKKD